MLRLCLALVSLLVASSAFAGDAAKRSELKDLYFGEALYDAYQGDYFDAIARLDTELAQYHRVDEPERDSLHYYINDAEFSVGDFELLYRMHRRAGRAIRAIMQGRVPEPVRNEAAYRLARIYYQKDRPAEALQALQRINGPVPEAIRDDLAFLRANTDIANARFAHAVKVLEHLQGAKDLNAFSRYNLGIALYLEGKKAEAYRQLDKAGQLDARDDGDKAIKDKANLVLGTALMENKQPALAKVFLDRVRLTGPFSNRALLASGWADAAGGHYDRALVPWTLLAARNPTDKAVQEAMLAAPYAYAKLNVYGQAALGYGHALDAFGKELDKLDASIKSIREGRFLQALTREELKQDKNWVIKLRSLPDSPETYYLMELMASNDFQESLKNYLDLDELRKKLDAWSGDLDAYQQLIATRRQYYQPLLPGIDGQFRVLDSKLRLRVEQRDRLQRRIEAMLVSPRPDFLATADERIMLMKLAEIERRAKTGKQPDEILARIQRLRGIIEWRIRTRYDRRLTRAYKNLQELNGVIDAARKKYASFVRTRQAATQSYSGYDDSIQRLRTRVLDGQERVKLLMARQGHMLEVMAINELEQRHQRLEEYQVKARFALADSYDRAVNAEKAESLKK